MHIATFTSLSLIYDPLIIYLSVKAASSLPGDWPQYAVIIQCIFMLWTKNIKLVGLFCREPLDIVFLPVSILFGYFHGLIKIYALLTLRITSWGSRPDGETNDNERMTPRARRSESINLPKGHYPDLIRYKEHSKFSPSIINLSKNEKRDFLQPSVGIITEQILAKSEKL